MAERKTIQLPLGGMHPEGAPAQMPDGATRLMENMVSPDTGQWEKRPPFLSDSMTVVQGLMLWEDHANQVARLVALQVNGANFDLRFKATSGETYGAAVTGTTGGQVISSYANYRGLLYYAMGSATGIAGVPAAIFSTNGATVTANPLGGETLYSKTITPFVDRLILGYVRASVVNQLGTTTAYDATGWTATTVTAANITNGSTVTSRIIPTATTLSKIQKADVYTIAASTTDTHLNFRSDLRNTSPTYEMPMTTEIYYSQVWTVDTVMAVGAIRVPTTLNGYRYRVTAIAGDFKTDAATEPTWPTTVGTTVVDDQVTWICDGLEQIAARAITLPTLTDDENFVTTWAVGTVPPMPASAKVGVRIKFGTEAVSTIELAGVDISLKDGVTDGNLNKKNRGQQLSVGKFFYPFFNQESSATATVDLDNDVYWTETSDPNTIRGSNFFRLRDAPGKVTAAATVGGRIVFFKRRGMWIFQGSADPDNPLILEDFLPEYGCISSRAVVVFEDRLYFIGENEVYEWTPGGTPKPLCGAGMREEVIANTTTFSVFPSLAVNPIRRELYVSVKADTAKGSTYVYQIDRAEWSRFRLGGTGTGVGYLVGEYIWNPTTKEIYALISTDVGFISPNVYRLDPTSVIDDDATGAIESYVTFRPIETFFPRREFLLDEVGVYHSVTGSQTNNTFEVQVSLNGGHTFTKYNRVTFPTVDAATVGNRFAVPLRQLGQRLVVRLYHSGDGGSTMFNVSAVDAVVRDIGPQRNLTTPTNVSSSL